MVYNHRQENVSSANALCQFYLLLIIPTKITAINWVSHMAIYYNYNECEFHVQYLSIISVH